MGDFTIGAEYTDRTGKKQKCFIRAFLQTNSGIKAVIEKADTHCLYEMNVEQLTITKDFYQWN